MAMINSKNTFIWVGGVGEVCTPINLPDLDGKLSTVFTTGQLGDDVPVSNPFLATIGSSYVDLGCGGIKMAYSNETSYEMGSITEGDWKVDNGRIGVNYPMAVTLSGGPEAAGEYKITTQFKNDKPVYKNGDWWLWFDGIVWVISTPGLDKDGKFYVNNSKLVNDGPYNTVPANVVVDENCIQIEGFDGDVESANGTYCKVGIVNGRPAFRSGSGEWYIFWHLAVPHEGGETIAKWVLTDSPYNLNNRWISNGTREMPDVFENPPNPSSSHFVGKTGSNPSATVPGAIITEAEVSDYLVVENAEAIIKTEIN